ncbi:MAG: WD40 repeat domain-containing protein [Crenarchaeota archaeon]|nr:WD40 repeat domain-containing protein [Thermoproteota archaeon]
MSSIFQLERDFTFYTDGGAVALDSDGEHVAIGTSKLSPRFPRSGEEGGHAYVVKKKGKVVLSWRFDAEKGFNCAAFSPSKDFVIFGNDDGKLYVFTYDGDLLSAVEVDSPVYSCAFSRSGSYLALGTEGGKVSVRDSNFEPLWEYLTEDNVWGLSWSPDERYVAAASHDGNVYILTKPKEVWKEDLGSPVNRVSWCGERLAAGTWEPGKVVVYEAGNPASPQKLWEKSVWGSVWGLEFEDACNYLAAGSSGKAFKVFAQDGREVFSADLFPVEDLSWNSAVLAVGGEGRVEVYRTFQCLPHSLPSLKRFKTISLTKPDNLGFAEMSEALYLLLGKPKVVRVNGEEMGVKVVKGNFLYIFSPYDGEVEVEVVDEA